MVTVWVCAGGGASEVNGLLPFLQAGFRTAVFQRKTPFRQKPGPKPGRRTEFIGGTGKGLTKTITRQLHEALQRGETCNLILVIDDLDCHSANERKKLFIEAVETVIPGTKAIIGFASPEIESWLIADWDNTFARDINFRNHHQAMRHWLVRQNIPFNHPEQFSSLDVERDTCQEKLSSLLQEVAKIKAGVVYSKDSHTSRLLQKIQVQIVAKKCPLFRKWHSQLTEAIALHEKS